MWNWRLLLYFVPASLLAGQQQVDSVASEIHLVTASKHFVMDAYDAAVQELAYSLAADPNNGAAHLKYAQIYSLQGDTHNKAQRHIQQAITHHPTNKHYYLEGIRIAHTYTDVPQVIAYYVQLMDALPTERAHYASLATLYLQQGDTTRALLAYKHLEQYTGYTKNIGLQRLTIYDAQSRTKKALATANQLRKTFPADETIQLRYVQLIAAQQGTEAALAYVIPLLDTSLPHGKLALYAGKCYLSVGKFTRAAAILRQAFKNPVVPLQEKVAFIKRTHTRLGWAPFLNTLCGDLLKAYPQHLPLLQAVAMFYATIDKPEQALALYVAQQQLGFINLSLFEQLISCLLQLKQYEQATQQLQDAMNYYPQQPQLYLLKGRHAYLQQDYIQAKKKLKKGLLLSIDTLLSSHLYTQLGDVHKTLAETIDADKCYEQALQLTPTHEKALSHYSHYLTVRKIRLPYAEKLSTRLITQYPNKANHLSTHAWLLYTTGRYQPAMQFIQQALQLTPTPSGELLEHYGDILYRLGKPKQARIQWKMAQGRQGTSTKLDTKIINGKLYE